MRINTWMQGFSLISPTVERVKSEVCYFSLYFPSSSLNRNCETLWPLTHYPGLILQFLVLFMIREVSAVNVWHDDGGNCPVQTVSIHSCLYLLARLYESVWSRPELKDVGSWDNIVLEMLPMLSSVLWAEQLPWTEHDVCDVTSGCGGILPSPAVGLPIAPYFIIAVIVTARLFSFDVDPMNRTTVWASTSYCDVTDVVYPDLNRNQADLARLILLCCFIGLATCTETPSL